MTYFSELKTAGTQASAEDKMSIVMSKIKLLGQEYSGTPHCFPIGEYFSYILTRQRNDRI